MSKKSTTQLMADPRAMMRSALSSKEGISIEFESSGQANDYRQRCYSIRQMDREASKRIHEPGTDEHGTSEFDVLVFQLYEKGNDGFPIRERGPYKYLKISCAGAVAFGMKSIRDLATGRAL